MHKQIDQKTGQIRAKYITIAPGQEATYMLKSAQAKALVASNYTLPIQGLMEAEMMATGDTIQVACARVITEEKQWEYITGLIEKLRRPAKLGILNASSHEEATVIYEQAIANLASLL